LQERLQGKHHRGRENKMLENVRRNMIITLIKFVHTSFHNHLRIARVEEAKDPCCSYLSLKITNKFLFKT